MIDLKGKTILVTGGSRGIGEAIVRAVAAAGAKAVLHYGRSRSPAEAIQKSIGPEICQLVHADLAEVGAAAAVWQGACAAAARIDVVVNNAGIFEPISVDAPPGEWQGAWTRVMQVNLYAAADLCKLAISHFRA